MSVVKGAHFLTVEEVQANTTELLRSLTESDMQTCFGQWKEHMEKRVDSMRSYFEGEYQQLYRLNKYNNYAMSHDIILSDFVCFIPPNILQR